MILNTVQSSYSRRETVAGPPRAAVAGSCWVGCRRESCSALAPRAGCCCVCSMAAGFGVMLQLGANASFLICSCVITACGHICDGILREGSAPHRRNSADLGLVLWDILVFVPFLCSLPSCSSQCFPWLPFLFAFPGRELSGLRAWLSSVFVQHLGCRGCKQS